MYSVDIVIHCVQYHVFYEHNTRMRIYSFASKIIINTKCQTIHRFASKILLPPFHATIVETGKFSRIFFCICNQFADKCGFTCLLGCIGMHAVAGFGRRFRAMRLVNKNWNFSPEFATFSKKERQLCRAFGIGTSEFYGNPSVKHKRMHEFRRRCFVRGIFAFHHIRRGRG